MIGAGPGAEVEFRAGVVLLVRLGIANPNSIKYGRVTSELGKEVCTKCSARANFIAICKCSPLMI